MPYLEHHPADFFPRHLLHDEIACPRLAIRRVFDEQVDLPDARRYLEKWLAAIFYDRRVLGPRFILLLMGLHDDMLKLLEAAYLLQQEDPQQRPPALIATADTAWDYLPRYLSRKEYLDPYRAIDKLCAWKTLPQWRDRLQDFFSAAVSGRCITSCINDENIYLTCRHLLKLVEATYLIKVREGGA